MDRSSLAQISALTKVLGKHLALLYESEAELLKAIHETDATAQELRRQLDEVKRVFDGMSKQSVPRN